MLPPSALFDGVAGPLRVVVVGTAAYALLVLFLRVAGKRTLSKMNAFDFVVTVALGSTLATVLLSSDVSLVEGVTALLLLILLQFAVTWTSVRSPRVQRWIKSEPRLLLRDGRALAGAMRAERVTEDELAAAARKHGHDDLGDVAAIILETDGSLSVIGRRQE